MSGGTEGTHYAPWRGGGTYSAFVDLHLYNGNSNNIDGNHTTITAKVRTSLAGRKCSAMLVEADSRRNTRGGVLASLGSANSVS